MPRVCLDPGHGGRDTGARTADGRNEKDSNLAVSLKVEALLKRQGFNVLTIRRDDTFIDLDTRCASANAWKADIFVSLHADAAGGPDVHGHHAIHSINSKPGQGGAKLARLLVDEVEKATGRQRFPATGSFFGGPGDGTWSRRGTSDPSRDFYAVIRETAMPAVIVERGFLTNPEDARLLFDDAFLNCQAEGIVRGVCAYFGAPFLADASTPQPAPPTGPAPAPPGTPLLGPAQVTLEQAQEWARTRGAHDRYLGVLPLYWQESPRYGVRPEVAVCQAAKETRFGQYGGVVAPEAHNWCGLKTRAGGANDDPAAHARFPDDLTGVRAHLQHLVRYAGGQLPAGDALVDPRFELVTPGAAPTVEALGGKWAPSPDYGASIVRDYLAGLLAPPPPAPEPTPAPAPPAPPEPPEPPVAPEPTPPARNPAAEIRRLIDRGALPAGMYDPRFPFTAGELAPVINDILDRLDRLEGKS